MACRDIMQSFNGVCGVMRDAGSGGGDVAD